MEKRKDLLPEVLSEGTLNYLLDDLLRRYTTARLATLYKCHLPDDVLTILTNTIDDEKLYKILVLFREQLTTTNNKLWSVDINRNVYYDAPDKEFWSKLTDAVNSIAETKYNTEFVYRLFVFYLRTVTHLLLTLTFKSMGINLNDSNVSVEYGSMGTPGRIAKMWICKDICDLTEPLSGRFALEPELVVFPASENERGKPVTVTLTINAMCSHHLFRFGNEFRNSKSRAVISYIPDSKVLGLSKINRWVEWVARRGWLQEELTSYIGETLKNKLETEDVYVGLFNMQHGCVAFRGKNDTLSYTTTEYSSGKYKDLEFRNQILNSLQ